MTIIVCEVCALYLCTLYIHIFVYTFLCIIIFSYVDVVFNICFMLVKHFELHFMYEKCYTNKLLT